MKNVHHSCYVKCNKGKHNPGKKGHMPHIHKCANMQTEVLCTNSGRYLVLTLQIQLNIWPAASGWTHFSIVPLFQCPQCSFICLVSLSFVWRYLSLSWLSLSHLCLHFVQVCIPISCLSLLSCPLIRHCPGCYPASSCWLVCVCVCAPRKLYLCHTLSPELDMCL